MDARCHVTVPVSRSEGMQDVVVVAISCSNRAAGQSSPFAMVVQARDPHTAHSSPLNGLENGAGPDV